METEDYNKIVVSICQDFFKIAEEATKDLDPKIKWLIRGRAAQYVFGHHFQLSYNASENILKNQRELDLKNKGK